MNTLLISNTDEFDDAVWQNRSNFSEEEYNIWLQEATNNLQMAIEAIEKIYDVDNENLAIIEEINSDVLGDLVNMLSSIRIKTECGEYNMKKSIR